MYADWIHGFCGRNAFLDFLLLADINGKNKGEKLEHWVCLRAAMHTAPRKRTVLKCCGAGWGVHSDGAHTGCNSKYLLCHFELCKCDSCLVILPPCQTEVLSLSLTKAQVPVDMAHEPCVTTQYPGCYLVMLTELNLKRDSSLSILEVVS